VEHREASDKGLFSSKHV